MAGKSTKPATNERIVQLLEQIQTQLAETRKQQDRLVRDVARLLNPPGSRGRGG